MPPSILGGDIQTRTLSNSHVGQGCYHDDPATSAHAQKGLSTKLDGSTALRIRVASGGPSDVMGDEGDGGSGAIRIRSITRPSANAAVVGTRKHDLLVGD